MARWCGGGLLLCLAANLLHTQAFIRPAGLAHARTQPCARTARAARTRAFAKVTPRTDQTTEEGAGQEQPSLGEPLQGQLENLEGGADKDWEDDFEKRLQNMYAQGTYDPTPVNASPEELAKQQWLEEFLNKEEQPIQWNYEYWLGTWLRQDMRFPSVGKSIKSFGFASVGILAITFMFLIEDEFLNPVIDDFNSWRGNDIFHVGEDVSAWVTSVPGRVGDYFAHFNWAEYTAKIATRAGAAPRWYNQMLGLPGDLPGMDNNGPMGGP